MAIFKRNAYFELGLVDDEVQPAQDPADLEEAKDSRFTGISSRSTKRRKFDTLSAGASNTLDEEIAENLQEETHMHVATQPTEVDDQTLESGPKQATTNPKLLTTSQFKKAQLKARKTGVIYLSRIPPFMRPSTIRTLLSPYGPTSRLFLTPEPPSVYACRIKAGGNKKRSYIDGWVEFYSKKHAKLCAETLNGQIIGGKKGGWYHDDIWNIRYLKGFKWADLMEQIQGEEKTREGRMRAEIQRETRERKAFLSTVEAAKREKGKEAKRQKREDGESTNRTDGNTTSERSLLSVASADRKQFERRFRQNEAKIRATTDAGLQNQPENVKRVLSKIF